MQSRIRRYDFGDPQSTSCFAEVDVVVLPQRATIDLLPFEDPPPIDSVRGLLFRKSVEASKFVKSLELLQLASKHLVSVLP